MGRPRSACRSRSTSTTRRCTDSAWGSGILAGPGHGCSPSARLLCSGRLSARGIRRPMITPGGRSSSARPPRGGVPLGPVPRSHEPQALEPPGRCPLRHPDQFRGPRGAALARAQIAWISSSMPGHAPGSSASGRAGPAFAGSVIVTVGAIGAGDLPLAGEPLGGPEYWAARPGEPRPLPAPIGKSSSRGGTSSAWARTSSPSRRAARGGRSPGRPGCSAGSPGRGPCSA